MIVNNVLPKISWLKGSKTANKSELILFAKKNGSTIVLQCLTMFFQVSIIANDYFLCFF